MHPRHLASSGSGLAALLSGALFVSGTGTALAQPSPMPTGGPGGAGEEEPKPEGIAEAAPKAVGLLTTTPTLPPPRDRRKKFEVVSIDGYMRTRADWFKNLHLGHNDSADLGGAPFPPPSNCAQATAGAPCSDSIKTANMRMRLEPTMQLSETISVHSQVDVFDNYVLGSLAANPDEPTIKANRAWAEVSTALGYLKFGRMPDHFGLGMIWNSGRRANTDYASWETLWQPGNLANIGGDNPVDYDLDADQGSTVDRVMFTAMIPGTPLRAAAALDWGGQVSTTAYPTGQDHDRDDNDDINQWMVSIARIDAPTEFADRLARGNVAVNVAARVQRTTVNWAYSDPTVAGDPPTAVPIDQASYLASTWLKLGWKKLLLEAEGAVEVGSIGNAAPLGRDGALDILTLGGIARVSAKALEDKLGFGVEVGAASGDASESAVQGRTHVRNLGVLPGPGEDTIRRFRFNPEYKLDLILFRELLGTVTNSAYVRPWVSYQLTNSITFHGQNVTAMAVRPIATPGNDALWGLELDADIAYRGNGFTAGLAYGGFFPLGAMNHPANLLQDGSPTEPVFGEGNTGDASNAHTFQIRLGVEF